VVPSEPDPAGSQRQDIMVEGFGDADGTPLPAAPLASPQLPDQPMVIVDDSNDVAIAPAPNIDAFLPRRSEPSPAAPRRSFNQVMQSLSARRTMIPILLTLGVALPLLGAAQWMIDPEYPFSARQMLWAAIGLPVIGLVMLGIAALNMANVKREMAAVSDR
jgi:hypothetical protein